MEIKVRITEARVVISLMVCMGLFLVASYFVWGMGTTERLIPLFPAIPFCWIFGRLIVRL